MMQVAFESRFQYLERLEKEKEVGQGYLQPELGRLEDGYSFLSCNKFQDHSVYEDCRARVTELC